MTGGRIKNLNVYFTAYGDVYAGYEFYEPSLFPDHRIIVPGTKMPAYNKLTREEKTHENIKKYCWLVPKDAIVAEYDDQALPTDQQDIVGQTWYPKHERKHLFILGAGTSANCVIGEEKNKFENDLLRPPLGTELFRSRFQPYYSKYKGVKMSLPSLQKTSAIDVEVLFEEDWKEIQESNNQMVMGRHISIQYYLQEILRDVSKKTIDNYYSNLFATFIDTLQKISHRGEKKQFAFVTFNQDTILDEYLQDYFGRKLLTFDDYVEINDSPFCLFKPHGSWNWGWRYPNVRLPDTANYLFDNKVNLFRLYYELLGNINDMVDWSGWGMEYHISKHNLGRYGINKKRLSIIPLNGDLSHFYPALLLPYRDKDDFIMPPKHYFTLQSYLHNIETVVISGWKGNEEAFNRMLFNGGHRITKVVIADPNPADVERNLAPLLSRAEVVIYKNFDHFVNDGLEKEII